MVARHLPWLMTPLSAAFAQVFYRHRQRRWRQLAARHAADPIADPLHTQRAFDHLLAAFASDAGAPPATGEPHPLDAALALVDTPDGRVLGHTHRGYWNQVGPYGGITAAVILQRAGLRTLVLEQNTYSGGMAATVELINGFRYEIAGSVQFPTAPEVANALELDTIPQVHAEVQSVNIGEAGEEPMIFYSDPMKYLMHLSEKHGDDAVMGMAKTLEWTVGPAGRFPVCPKTSVNGG